jgi:hypothetical protein
MKEGHFMLETFGEEDFSVLYNLEIIEYVCHSIISIPPKYSPLNTEII